MLGGSKTNQDADTELLDGGVLSCISPMGSCCGTSTPADEPNLTSRNMLFVLHA